MNQTISLGSRRLGSGQPCFIAAEIGINHNGDMKLARAMIDAAADAGADAVKFQNYRTENMVIDRKQTYQYISRGRPVKESQFEMFKRCELKPGQLAELCDYAGRKKIMCFSTPMDEAGVAECVEAGCPLLKNGSDCLGHLPLISAMARTGLPTVLSTGMATHDEISDAVQTFRRAGGLDLILLVCTSSYPTPPVDVHLRKIPALATACNCLAGFSDHTAGNIAALGAVALGAVFIEKHFTTSRNLPGPDHSFSSTPSELAQLVGGVRELEAALGSPVLEPSTAEARGRLRYRLSCAARSNFPAGHRLAVSDILFLRPGTGLPPKHRDQIVGKVLKRSVRAGTVFASADFT